MLREIRPAIIILVLLTAITGLAYPLAMTAIAGVIFPKQAQGSLIEKDGKVVGSALIGQEFKDDKYFHGRPSATVAPDPADSTKTVPAPYNAANSGGSNLGPTSKALNDRVKEDVEKLKAENPSAPVPVDLVTTSALLDLVSAEWLERLAVEAAARRLPVYAALTYQGSASLDPAEPFDLEVIAAVNRHQRRDKGFGLALGPEAGEWLQQATLAVRARVPLDVLRDTIQPFPTFSEIYVGAIKALYASVGERVGSDPR